MLDPHTVAGHELHSFAMPVICSNMYIVLHGHAALVVDPCVSEEAEELLSERGVTECVVFLTHEHFDHISGVNRLREIADCKVICTKTCGERIRDPKKNCAAYFEAIFMDRDRETVETVARFTDHGYSCSADIMYAGSMELRLGDMTVALDEAPGHSPGGQVIAVNGTWFFTGDYLIPGEPVILRFPGGSRRDYEAVTRPYLDRIPFGGVILPGHGEPWIKGDET